MIWLLFILTTSQLLGQSKYPADSLLNSSNISIFRKTALVPIMAWQRLSYNSKLFNCQFDPSCSNYGAVAIKQHGFIIGGIITSDRIVRCNPFAFRYHLDSAGQFHSSHGRLIDPLHPIISARKPKKSPLMASIFSALIPGSGRIYAERPMDGLMGMTTTYQFAAVAYFAKKENYPNIGYLFSIITLLVYSGEIYGSWRSAKYYQKSNNVEIIDIEN